MFSLVPIYCKNAMGVGIPGTGMVGLPIAVALGALIGKSEYELEVLRDLSPESLEEGKQMVDSHCINIALKENVDKLYIEIVAYAADNFSKVVISHEHTNFVYVEKNGEILLGRKGMSILLMTMLMMRTLLLHSTQCVILLLSLRLMISVSY